MGGTRLQTAHAKAQQQVITVHRYLQCVPTVRHVQEFTGGGLQGLDLAPGKVGASD